MKRLFSYLITSVFITLFSSITYAQNAQNPWAISVGADLINLQGKDAEKGTNFGLPALSLSRYLSSGFSVGVQYALNNVDIGNGDQNYSSLDGIIKYNLTEGNIMPYLFAGYGFSRFEDGSDKDYGLFPSRETSKTILGGVGANFFLNDKWAINASTSYRSAYESSSYKHLQHVVGLSYNFGAGDADKDGVSDQKDVCPDVPGLKEFDGCPDTDGDGIPDNKDKCPEEAGTEALEGCPDSDGDGIADADDACPNEAGTAAMNGCPDSDGDGIADNEDKCPNEAGEAANNGCPWGDADGDGVNDNEDKCPNEAGPASNDGCPEDEMPEAIANFINSEKARILFNASKTTLRSNFTSNLDELANLLSQYSSAVVTIEGHASSDGSDTYNQALSERRANAVKAYLVGKGIDASRINTIGFGETKPIDNNDTAKGRRNNRRAQIERRAEIKVN